VFLITFLIVFLYFTIFQLYYQMEKTKLLTTKFFGQLSQGVTTKYGTTKYQNLEKEKKTDSEAHNDSYSNEVHPLYQGKKKRQNTDRIGSLYFIAVD